MVGRQTEGVESSRRRRRREGRADEAVADEKAMERNTACVQELQEYYYNKLLFLEPVWSRYERGSLGG